MARYYVTANRDQAFLMPPDLRDWLPEQDLAWTVVEATAQLDLSRFAGKYRADGAGRPRYHPALMVALLLFAYCEGVRSSRVIEARCQRDIGYRVVCGNQVPDHATIARFRKDHREALGDVFVQVLRLLHAAGMVQVGLVALDGSKLRGDARGTRNRTAQQLDEEIAELRGQVEAMLADADTVDAAEDDQYGDTRGDEPPDQLRRRADRLAALEDAKARLDAEVTTKAEAAQAAQDARREQWDADRAAGKKVGRPPGEQPPKTGTNEPKINLTDPDSKIMESHGSYCQGYNGQLVATSDQIIVAADITNCSADNPSLHPMLDTTRSTLDAAGITDPVRVCVADSGYGGHTNLSHPAEPLLLIATKTGRSRRNRGDPKHPAIQAMNRRLANPAGKRLYRRRAGIIESCIGQLKNRLGGWLAHRGLDAITTEWKLMATSHNLLKLHRHTLAPAG